MRQPGTIDCQREGTRATVTLRRAGKMNAMTRAMWRDLRTVFLDLSAQDGLRCVLVQGEGADFCAGGDISEYPGFRFDAQSLEEFHEREVWGALQAMCDCPVPVVAAIAGNCMGAGLEIASCCDLRMGAQDSRYGAPIAKLGFPMAEREAALVLAAVGRGPAAAMLLAAEVLDAAAMQRSGFLTWVHPPAQLAVQAQALCARLQTLSPLAGRRNKQSLRMPVALAPAPQAYAYADHPEHREGVMAFLEKRPAAF